MPQGSKPQTRKFPLFPAAALFLSFPLFFAIFIPNPLLDALASAAATAALGRSVRVHQARIGFPLFGKRTYFQAREVDLSAVLGASGAASSFVSRYRLSEWFVLRDVRGAWTRCPEGFIVRLLEARAGEVALKGGARFKQGRWTRGSAAVWLPAEVWGRFPNLVEKRFSQDERGRRVFKLTWNAGRWRLWGRSAPVLEASWR